MRKIVVALIWMGVLAGTAKLAMGALAPWRPQFEIVNHFRPYGLIAAILLFGLALRFGRRRMVVAAGALTVMTLGLFILPFAYAMPKADGARGVRLMTLNVWRYNPDRGRAVPVLLDADPDVIVLQEVGPAAVALFASRLAPTYPHAASCASLKRSCALALFSKRPWIEASAHDLTETTPTYIRARFAHDGLSYDVIGLHMNWPFQARGQAKQIDGLIDLVRRRSGPLIMAGDFNLTPFSWMLTKFAHATGLRRAATLGGSWSSLHPFPAVLIDHVFATKEFGLVEGRIGPDVGSDHLPMRADLRVNEEN